MCTNTIGMGCFRVQSTANLIDFGWQLQAQEEMSWAVTLLHRHLADVNHSRACHANQVAPNGIIWQ
jgi:hypothetical protein